VKINSAQLMVCVCALTLCYLWFDFTTPRIVSTRQPDHYDINSSAITIDLIGWSVIAIVALIAYKATGKK
jgi:hypothetical protein